jgi:hypothetical protein
MNDRGEKIVSLAREILRAEDHEDLALRTVPARSAISFKVLCFATLLAAIGSSAITEWSEESTRPINRYEKTELDALVFYAGRMKGLDEDALRHEIEMRAGVNDFNGLTHHDYEIAKDFLYSKIR